MRNHQIAILGAGPAGSFAAAKLAAAGQKIVLVDEKLAWEKPCGGGITHKAIVQYPCLRDSQVERNWVDQCEIVSPAGRRVVFGLREPIAIFSREVLNGLLLEMAQCAGAEVVHSRATSIARETSSWRIQTTLGSIDADYVVLATGARNPFRAQFSRPFTPDDLMATAGYYIAGSSGTMKIQFLRGLHGYIWIFPRSNHFSAGICGKMSTPSTAELRRLLESHLNESGFNLEGARFYAHVLPALTLNTLRHSPICGTGWAMIGDAAGFTDPITGEGLYYALRSAELLSQALLDQKPESYPQLLRKDFLRELEMAARVSDRFFSGSWMGEAVTERMVQFTAHSARFRQLMRDMFSGSQGYINLRQRLYRALPAMVAESAVSALGLRGRASGSTMSKAS
ncbi:MAG TPA: NAD(P)/FAD-dependent oxidoreductase [Terriglobales bacterium]|nr:NAD(P)/FAD-dependent oxidoreductase [Terriglobales bacterium]